MSRQPRASAPVTSDASRLNVTGFDTRFKATAAKCRAALGNQVVEPSAAAELETHVVLDADATATDNLAVPRTPMENGERARSRRSGYASGICTFCCMSLPPAGDLVGAKHAFSKVLPLATTTQCRLCHGPMSFEESWVHHVRVSDSRGSGQDTSSEAKRQLPGLSH